MQPSLRTDAPGASVRPSELPAFWQGSWKRAPWSVGHARGLSGCDLSRPIIGCEGVPDKAGPRQTTTAGGPGRRHCVCSGPFLAAREVLGREFPVEQIVDHSVDVIGATILIVEIVGVLPH